MSKLRYKLFYKEHRNTLVHRGTVLEGMFTQEYQTAEIIEQGISHGVSAFALMVTTNLLDAWNYIFLSRSSDRLYVLKEIHKRISKGLLEPPFYPKDRSAYYGRLRDFSVQVRTPNGIYVPPVPDEREVTKELNSRKVKSVEDALILYADLCKAQLFGDCNKRTAYLFVNYLMVKENLGYFFLVPDVQHYNEYVTALTNYYDGLVSHHSIVSYLSSFLVKVN